MIYLHCLLNIAEACCFVQQRHKTKRSTSSSFFFFALILDVQRANTELGIKLNEDLFANSNKMMESCQSS